jgi:hypothetical protein
MVLTVHWLAVELNDIAGLPSDNRMNQEESSTAVNVIPERIHSLSVATDKVVLDRDIPYFISDIQYWVRE